MDIEKAKPVEVRIEGLKIKQFFNKKFVEELEKNIKDIKFQHFCLFVVEKEGEKIVERIIIGHERRKDEEEEITNIGSTSPGILQKLLKIVKNSVK